MTTVNVLGAGLAGSEAAYQLARRSVPVRLFEMRPASMTPAHRTAFFGELVCSNSLKSVSPETASGVLKEEMRRLGSLVMAAAEAASIPAGSALAVDREEFGRFLTATLEGMANVEIVRREVTAIPEGPTIVASGPLTSPALERALQALAGPRHLYFYDAVSPVVTAESIDMARVFRASRYGQGGDDYINCPLSRQEYEAFVEALVSAEVVAPHPFERAVYFEGCVPIEELARRGRLTLAFGPMRPVGLVAPLTGRRPFAVVQLRGDDRAGTLYNIVGFQTKMTYGAQRAVLRMIPGLEKAEFVRYGSLHRNTFLNSPALLRPSLQLRGRDDLFVAGQLTGVEGYLESAATGLVAALNAARLTAGAPLLTVPAETVLGSLIGYITDPARGDFQPMNANFGLLPALDAVALRGREKKRALAERARAAFERWIEDCVPEAGAHAAWAAQAAGAGPEAGALRAAGR